MNILLVLASVMSVGFAWRLQRITSSDSPAVVRAVRASGLAALFVVIIAGYSQYQNEVAAKNLRSNEIDLEVSEKLAERRISILDSYFHILVNSANTYNFLQYSNAIAKHAPELINSLGWEKIVDDRSKKNLRKTEEALNLLHTHAKEILDMSIRYPSRVPFAIQRWASETVKIQFKDLPKYIDAYNETSESQKYARELGDALGTTISAVRKATNNLER